MRQPTLFENKTADRLIGSEEMVLYALGDFQSRGKILAERDLPLDRLRGALRRAAEVFGAEEMEDEQAVAALAALGAIVRRVPNFVAKHPFRVMVPTGVAERASVFHRAKLAQSS